MPWLPGTDEERGIVIWRESPQDDDSDDVDYENLNTMTMKTYDFPFGMNLIRSLTWGKYVPFFPTFQGFDDIGCSSCCKNDIELDDVEVVFQNDIKGHNENSDRDSEQSNL